MSRAPIIVVQDIGELRSVAVSLPILPDMDFVAWIRGTSLWFYWDRTAAGIDDGVLLVKPDTQETGRWRPLELGGQGEAVVGNSYFPQGWA